MSYCEKQIKEHYENYDEDRRLIKDNSHRVEFITTTNYLDKYISKGDKILEVGAATGRYSFYYSEKGYDVTALELCEKQVEIMINKSINKNLSTEIVQGNALDLSRFDENTYDVVLCLGPIYHLTAEEDRQKCIEECLRVLNPGGILAVAYINRFSTFVNMINRDKENINDLLLHNIVKTGTEFGDSRDCFYHSNYDEIEKLMNDNNLNKLTHIATDGISDILRLRVNEFNEEEFDLWMNYHLETCDNPNLMGYTQHGLYIGRK